MAFEPLNMEEVKRFFQHHFEGKRCPICDGQEFFVDIDDPPKKAQRAEPALVHVPIPAGGHYTSYMPLVAVACNNCGHLDLFAMGAVRLWLEKNPDGRADPVSA